MKISDLFENADPGSRPVTREELKSLTKYLDLLWAKIKPAAGIKTDLDTTFTGHFLDRVNDPRNQRQITLAELGAIFKKAYQTYGKKIVAMGADTQAVLTDMRSDINIPFVLTWDRDNNELDLVAKTVMRKKGFKSTNPAIVVEKNS